MKKAEKFMKELKWKFEGKLKGFDKVVIFPDANNVGAVLAQFKTLGPMVVGVGSRASLVVTKAATTSDEPNTGIVVIAVATDAEADQPV
jgi:hypothetical protein